ncbi:5727_t:CDS:2, partial [Gigaspora margarita]
PSEVKEEISNLEEQKTKITEELNNQAPTEVEEKQTQLLKKQEELKEEVTDKRPDISVTEKEFWDDYACRPTLDKFAEQNQQLAEAQAKITEYQKEIKDLEK